MTFVFPVLLGGAALAAIPILIHLMRQQKPRTVRFPAMRFLLKNHKSAKRKVQLRHLLLLLLRIALLLLICLAIAQPKLLSDQFNLATDQPVAAVFVFDTSYSMEYKTTGGQSRLQDAKKRALKLLEKLPSQSRVAILDTGVSLGDPKKAWCESLDQAQKQIRDLRLRHVNTPVTTQLPKAISVFQSLRESTFDDSLAAQLPRLLCVFSDATTGCWESSQAKDFFTTADKLTPQLLQLKRFQRTINGQIELLDELPAKLPPMSGKDYPQQPLIDALRKLDGMIADLSEVTYPDTKAQQIIAGILARNRIITKQVRDYPTEKLDKATKSYREQLLKSLATARKDLSGFFGIFVNVGLSEPIDMGITSILFPRSGKGYAGQQLFHPKETPTIRATVRATGKTLSSSVLCKIDGKLLKQKHSLTLKSGYEESVHFRIDCSKLAPGFHQGEVFLGSSDALAFNNRRLFTFAIREPRRILIITDDVNSAKVWATKIETAKVDALFRTERVDAMKAEAFGPADMRQYAAIYLFNVANPSPKLWTSLYGYVTQGGNIAIIPAGKDTNKDAYNRNPTAKKLMPGELRAVPSAPKGGFALGWRPSVFQHPLFQPFREMQRRGVSFFRQAPRLVYKYWEVEPYKDNSSILIEYADNDKTVRPAVLERSEKGGGVVVLLTTRLNTGQDPKWNNYMEDTTWFTFVLPGELTEYLAGRVQAENCNYILGQTRPVVRIPFAVTDKLLQLRGPGGDRSVTREDSQHILRFEGFTLPGNYSLRTKEKEIGGFTLSMPKSESDLAPVAKEDIEDVLGPDSIVLLEYNEDLLEELKKGHLTEPIPLFPYLMIGLLVLLALENLLGNLFYRSRNPQPES